MPLLPASHLPPVQVPDIQPEPLDPRSQTLSPGDRVVVWSRVFDAEITVVVKQYKPGELFFLGNPAGFFLANIKRKLE